MPKRKLGEKTKTKGGAAISGAAVSGAAISGAAISGETISGTTDGESAAAITGQL